MKGRRSFDNRAPRSPARLLLLWVAAATLGLAIAAFPDDSDPLRELAAQPPLAVSATFTHPGPQVVYAAP
jgi:hypothetical protein